MQKRGKVQTVIVKDMSRMGRDYLKVGYYTESFFAERDIRYIAINDGVDSDKGDNDFTPFSQPVQRLLRARYQQEDSGCYAGQRKRRGTPLYQSALRVYERPSGQKKKWMVDEEAAEIVKRIF